VARGWQLDRKENAGFGSAPTVDTPCAQRPVNARRFTGDVVSRHFVATLRDQSPLMRVARRESFRETVFLCSRPLVIAR